MKAQAEVFGEILFDVYPGYKRLGGAPFNFAYHLHRFGLEVTFISRIGEDRDGQEILQRLRQLAFPAHALQRDPGQPTGTVVVTLQGEGIPSFQIVEPAAYDFIAAEERLLTRAQTQPALFYFGTLAQRHAVSRQALHMLLRHAGAPPLVMCDLNLRQSFYTPEILRYSLRAGNVLKINEGEFAIAQQLLHLAEQEAAATRQLMQQFEIKYVCITKGDKGSALYSTSETAAWQRPVRNAPDIVDTVGAGDAYAAVLAFGLLAQWPLQMIIERASLFAGAICTISGAIPEAGEFYAQHAPWLKPAN